MHRTAYFLSDLHIGADRELDDFSSDDAFCEFFRKICDDQRGAGFDLVLLGDVFDLWQVVPEADKTQPNAAGIDLALEAASEAARVRTALDRHSRVPGALRALLDTTPARIVIVYGNHDHSLVVPQVQDALRSAIGASPDRLVFSVNYDNPELRVYAEHGNQYDRGNNDYPAFERLEECAGYYFVRLFWNRLEPRAPALNRLYPDSWLLIFRWILENRRWDLLMPALRYFRQYRGDRRVPKYIDVPGVPFMMAPGEPPPAVFEACPELLFRDTRPAAGHVFSADPGIEMAYRRQYVRDAAFRAQIDAYYVEHFGTKPKFGTLSVAAPQQPLAASAVRREDAYTKAIARMFTGADNAQAPYFRAGRTLDPGTYDYVLFGHTHQKLAADIPRQPGKRYLNTGAWVSRVDLAGNPLHMLTYARLQRDDAGHVEAALEDWK